jgi:hypothetical protein
MVKTLVNLTHQALIAEIENALDSYPYHPYRQAFANPDLRQDLIAYVLSRIPCTYSAIDQQNIPLFNYKLPRCYFEQQLQLENLVHQGICCILQDKADWVNCHVPQPHCSVEPSHWFG